MQLEIRCKMIESRFQDEALRLQQQHDADVKKVWCSFSYCYFWWHFPNLFMFCFYFSFYIHSFSYAIAL